MRVTGVAAEAEHIYREAATRLAEVAAEQRAAGHPLSARKFGKRALLAIQAARAEVFDPEPVVGPDCGCEDCRAYLFHVQFERLMEGQA